MKETKTIVIGVQNGVNSKKIIKVHRSLGTDFVFSHSTCSPKEYNFLELICLNYNNEYDGDDKYDLIFAYDDPDKRNSGVLYLGEWNDGVVE